MNTTTVTTPNELEIRVERIFDAPRAHVFSVWTDPELIPEWWGDGTVVEEMDVRPGGTYRFRTAYGVVEGEFREVDAPERLVQTFQNHLQTLEFEDLGERTKLTQTMRFATTEERDTTMQYGVEEGAKSGFARIDAVLQRLRATRERRGRRRRMRAETHAPPRRQPRPDPRAGRAREQPQGRQRRAPEAPADGVHRRLRLGQELARVRHDRRGVAAADQRDLQRLRAGLHADAGRARRSTCWRG